jgi:flagellar motor switch protein FliG
MSSGLDRALSNFQTGEQANNIDASSSFFLGNTVNEPRLSNSQKAAIVLYVLGPIRAAPIFEKLDEKDHRAFANSLHKMGFVATKNIEEVLKEYLAGVTNDGPIRGGSNEARRFLSELLPQNMVEQIMEEVDGRYDANIWDRVSLAPEQTLAHYLRGEQTQTIAVILSRIKSEKAAKVIDLFSEDKASTIIQQMARLGSIDRNVLDDVQQALRHDFLTMLMKQSTTRKPSDIIASILNNIPGTKSQEFLDQLREVDEATADIVQRTMFTFEDFTRRIDPVSLQKVIKEVPSETLIKALKMAQQKQPDVYNYFINNMSKRAAEGIIEEIESYGALRLKDAEMAQQDIIVITRELAKSGNIEIMDIEEGSSDGGAPVL